MNFKLKMRFVIFARFYPSIPQRGVVAISPLFHFRRWEIFAFALVGDIYPSSKNLLKRISDYYSP
jgi:hypothetical protein